jgi:RND family efflux transporter MFP subunit
LLNKYNNLVRVLAILLGGIVISVLLIKLNPGPQSQVLEPPAAQPAEVVSVALVNDTITVSSQGTVNAKVDIDVTAQVSGQVIAVSKQFAVGGLFVADETLLQIDQRDYQSQLAKAESLLATAKKDLATEKGQALQARREWKDLGSAEANELFLRKPQLQAAEAAVKAAIAEVDSALLALQRTSIKLPFAGRIVRTDVNLGQFLPTGSSIARVMALDVMEIKLPVTAHQAQLLNLNIDGRPLSPLAVQLKMAVGSSSSISWQGKVVRVDPQVDKTSRLFHLIAEVHQPAHVTFGGSLLLPGSFVEAKITSRVYQNIAVLPRAALYQRDKVMLLDEEHHLQITQIEVLQSTDTTLVVKGLNEGDLVLIKTPALIDLSATYKPVFSASAQRP